MASAVKIIFNPNGGEFIDSNQNFFWQASPGVSYGSVGLPFPNVSNGARVFLGWYEKGVQSGVPFARRITASSVVGSSDVVLHAFWRGIDTCYLTFCDLTGTNASLSRDFIHGISSNLPWLMSGLGWAVPSGKSLDHSNTWNTDPYGNGTSLADHASLPADSSIVSGATASLYASWVTIYASVQFVANGDGATVAGETSVTWDYMEGVPYGRFPYGIWRGHRFLGWFTAASGGTQVLPSATAVGTVVLYAHWEVGNLVTFNPAAITAQT